MKNLRLGVVFAWVLALVLSGLPVCAQQPSAADQKKNEEQAMTVLKRMADFLSQQKRFSVTMNTNFDVVQNDGQKIEFGEIRKVVLVRPDLLRVDAVKRDGSKSELIFNGKDITLYFAKENVYATAARPGSIDQAIAYFINDLDMRLPLAEMLDTNLAKMLPEQVHEAAYVEKSFIAGVPCDQVAFRGNETDLQLWVAQGDKPLPQRVVITYTRIDGRPQFRAQFSDWNLAPKVPDSLFVFKPPAGAKKIAFAPKQMLQPGGEVTKEGKQP